LKELDTEDRGKNLCIQVFIIVVPKLYAKNLTPSSSGVLPLNSLHQMEKESHFTSHLGENQGKTLRITF